MKWVKKVLLIRYVLEKCKESVLNCVYSKQKSKIINMQKYLTIFCSEKVKSCCKKQRADKMNTTEIIIIKLGKLLVSLYSVLYIYTINHNLIKSDMFFMLQQTAAKFKDWTPVFKGNNIHKIAFFYVYVCLCCARMCFLFANSMRYLLYINGLQEASYTHVHYSLKCTQHVHVAQYVLKNAMRTKNK